MQKAVWAIIVIVVAIVAVVLLTGNEAQAPLDRLENGTTTEETADTSPPAADDAGEEDDVQRGGEEAAEEAPSPATISYTGAGFSPSSLTVSQGETVIFINNSDRDFWPASAVHPTHRRYSGISLSNHCPDPGGSAFDACRGIASGQSWSFTFEKTGEWAYHDHLRAGATGVIVVE